MTRVFIAVHRVHRGLPGNEAGGSEAVRWNGGRAANLAKRRDGDQKQCAPAS
jgi:hypothetical protein